jgi:quercetin dioxygenase-like cupin family protein
MPVQVVRPEDRNLEVAAKAAGVAQNLPSSVTQQARVQVLQANAPYVHISELPPGGHVPMHSHSQPEVTIVLSGNVRIGDEECGPGTVFMVPADERYALDVGIAEPLVFVVVRPQRAEYHG